MLTLCATRGKTLWFFDRPCFRFIGRSRPTILMEDYFLDEPIFGPPTFRRWFRMLTEFVLLHCRWYVYLFHNTYSFAGARHCLLPTAISYCILRFVHNLNCLSWQLTSCRHIALENLIFRVLNAIPFSSFSRLRTEFYLNFMVCGLWQGDVLSECWWCYHCLEDWF